MRFRQAGRPTKGTASAGPVAWTILQKLLGHSTPAMTMRYAHLSRVMFNRNGGL
jgi:integrase